MRMSSPSAPANKRSLAILFLTLFLDLVGFSIIFPLFPAMLEYYLPNGAGDATWLGQVMAHLVSLSQQSGASNPNFMATVLFGGLMGSLYSILQFIFAPIWGAYSDRYGRRPILLLTILGLAISYALWIFASSFYLLLVSRIIGGIMGGNLSVATAAIADISSKEKRSASLAIVGIAFGLGFIIGPAIGGLSTQFNLLEMAPSLGKFGVNPFSFAAAISFVLCLINLGWVYAKFDETLALKNRAKKQKSPYLRLFQSSHGDIRRTNFTYLFYMIAFSGMEFTLTFLAVERFQYSPLKNGLMFVYIGLLLVFVQGGLVRRLATPVGEKRLALIGLLLGISAFLCIAVATNEPSFYLGLGLMAFSIGLCSPTLNALVSLFAKDDEQGASLGAFRSAGSLARAIGPLTAAWLYFSLGSVQAYTWGAIAMLLPLLLLLFLPQPSREP